MGTIVESLDEEGDGARTDVPSLSEEYTQEEGDEEKAGA
jgi:hypothetical protein